MTPICQRVSLTGPDDHTAITDLVKLSAQFPFVEWALLYVPHNEGAPRNPTAKWRQQFSNTPKKGFTAVHLCGSLAFQQLLSDTLPEDLLLANRLQLNINARKQEFTNDEVLTVYEKALQLGPDIILQYHEGTAFLIEMFLDTLSADHKSRVHVLLDGSKGKGVAPTTWDAPKALVHQYLGFAGGLGPHNITELMTLLNARGLPYWPDMESGLRTENEFDLQKVVSVLVQANLLVK